MVPPSELDGVKTSTTPKVTEESDLKEHDLKTSTAPEHISAKAKRLQPRFLTLLVCASYLLLHFLGVDLGLRLIKGYTEPRLHRAEVQLEAATYNLKFEQFVHRRLDFLLGTTLDQHYTETFGQCLARGLATADIVFYGDHFIKDADVRKQTMDWVTDNCGRLFHTPELHAPETPSVWTCAQKLGRIVKKVHALYELKAARFLRSLFSMDPWPLAETVVTATNKRALKQRQTIVNTSWKGRVVPPMKLPSGFRLDCIEPVPCRLQYSGLFYPTSNTSKQALVEARNQVRNWKDCSFEKVLRLNGHFIDWMALLPPLFANCFLTALLISRRCRPQSQPQPNLKLSWVRVFNGIARLKADEQLAIGLIIDTTLYLLLRYQLEYITAEFDRALLPAGLGLCIFHSPQILVFFNPFSGRTESIRSACRSVLELHNITQGAEVPQPAHKKPACFVKKNATTSDDTKPTSKIGARFISPLTPISEDLQQERKAMHAEQGKQPRVDFEPEIGYATETDSEYDSDVQHASYIDLTGGAIPTISEDEEDWSIVED